VRQLVSRDSRGTYERDVQVDSAFREPAGGHRRGDRITFLLRCMSPTCRHAADKRDDAVTVKPPRPLVQRQFGDLPSITVDEVKTMLEQGVPVQVIDTRRLRRLQQPPRQFLR
jgi:hypothetical protein